MHLSIFPFPISRSRRKSSCNIIKLCLSTVPVPHRLSILEYTVAPLEGRVQYALHAVPAPHTSGIPYYSALPGKWVGSRARVARQQHAHSPSYVYQSYQVQACRQPSLPCPRSTRRSSTVASCNQYPICAPSYCYASATCPEQRKYPTRFA